MTMKVASFFAGCGGLDYAFHHNEKFEVEAVQADWKCCPRPTGSIARENDWRHQAEGELCSQHCSTTYSVV